MIWSTDKGSWLGYPTSLGLTIKWSLFSILRTDFTTTTTSDETFDGYVKNVKKAQTSLANLLDTLNELRVHMINQVRTVRIWNPDASGFPMIEKTWFANDLDFKWALKSESKSIWNPNKWPPFYQKTFEIWTIIWMVWIFNGWDCLEGM